MYIPDQHTCAHDLVHTCTYQTNIHVHVYTHLHVYIHVHVYVHVHVHTRSIHTCTCVIMNNSKIIRSDGNDYFKQCLHVLTYMY